MKTVIFSILALFVSQYAQAGASNKFLNCVSDSKRTTVFANVPGDFDEHLIEFAIDGKMLSWMHYYDSEKEDTVQNSTVMVHGSMKNRNFRFVIKDMTPARARVFHLVAIPETIRLKRTPNGETATLRAIVYGVDPRDGNPSKEIEVGCTYKFEI